MTVPRYSETETTVINALKKKPGSTMAGLVAASHSARSTVRNALIKAEAAGHLMVAAEWPRKYTWLDIMPTDSSPVETSYVVIPDLIQPKEFGKRFNAGRPNIVKVLTSIDLAKHDRDKILSDLEAVSRAVTGLYVALGQVEDGPEWRQEAGL